MASGASVPSLHARLAHATPWLLFAWFLLLAAYAWTANADFISRDQWRFMPMLDHYLSGKLDWHELWESHSEHVKPGYKLLFLWNARFLGLDTMVELMTGILCLGAAAWLLLREMAQGEARLPPLALLAAGMVTMSFNQWANYSYSLLSLGGFGGLLVQAAVMILFARLLARGLDRREGALLLLAFFLGVFGFSGARTPALMGACSAAAVLAWLLVPETRARILRYALPFLLLGVACIGVYFSLLHRGDDVHVSLLDDLGRLLRQPLGAFGYASGILAESMFDITRAGHFFGRPPLILCMDLIGYPLLLWSLWRYFRVRLWQRSWVPFMLIAYSALFTLEVLVARYGGSDDTLHGSSVPRYVFDVHLWMVGSAWILGLDLSRGDAFMPSRRLAAIGLALILALELCNLGVAGIAWRYQRELSLSTQQGLQDAAAGRGTLDGLPPWVCPKRPLCDAGLQVLEKYRLNVARETTSP